MEKSLFSYSGTDRRDTHFLFSNFLELLQFRNEKFDPFPILEKGITHAPIREMISQMLVRDRTQRKESFTHWYAMSEWKHGCLEMRIDWIQRLLLEMTM